MAKKKDVEAKKQKEVELKKKAMPDAYIESSGIVIDQKITATLEKNYMPYAMSIIVSRCLPEIDGFKPSHRKLLYTMYKMGLLSNQNGRTKSANVVGQTMKLNPHGDQAIYETMVRLARGNEALLHPYVDSKGNFGKAYSRDMSYAASRYTEVKLDEICNELFADIDKETVEFVPNYDNKMNEPTLFPTRFPTVLVNYNVGIAVSMASNVCPFNLSEICETTIALLKNPSHDAITTLKGPDFPGGGYMLYDEDELKSIYDTGRGSVKIRSRYRYDKLENCIEITEIPPTTTIEAIMDKIVEHIKVGKIRDIVYIRDETDLQGLKIAIDLKRGVDPDRLMARLFRTTPLQDSFSCNFNILIGGTPKVMGVYEIINEWTAFRKGCVKKRVYFELKKKQEKLHLLKGLRKILLDIDKAVKVVRETTEETEVISNLMIQFGIDEIQAEFVAEIKLRQLNREFILKRVDEVDQLDKDIVDMQDILSDDKKIRQIIIGELKDVIKKYQKPRLTKFFYAGEMEEENDQDDIPDYAVNIFFTRSGYFKKITPHSLRTSGEHKLKDGDVIDVICETTNKCELLFFTDKCQVYKTKASLFDDTKVSVMGEYIPAKLGFDEGEVIISMVTTIDYSEHLLIVFDNGKAAKIPLTAYETKTNRKKLTNAYSDKANIVSMLIVGGSTDVIFKSTNGRVMMFNTEMILPKTARDSIGVQVMNLKAKASLVESAFVVTEDMKESVERYRVKTLPADGNFAKDLKDPNQLILD